MSERMVKRHTAEGIFIHWFNALCWFFLLATGLGLIRNPELQPLGAWWPDLLGYVFGGSASLLTAHWVVGAIWAGTWVLFLLIGILRHTLPFLRQMLTYRLGRDLQWMVKKNLQLLFGGRNMAKLVRPLGWDGRLPEQEFYNAGQKAAALGMILGGVAVAVTGFVMLASKHWLGPAQVPLVQWSIVVHFVAAGVTFGILLIHIYMAAVSVEERPAFFSMFSGEVPEEYAREHHRIWFEALQQKTKKGR